MAKTATVLLHGTIYSINVNIPRDQWVPVDDYELNMQFINYHEDKNGGLAHLYQPMCGGPDSIEKDIHYIRRNPRLAFSERFDEAVIKSEDGREHKILHDVDITGILEALKVIMGAWPLYKHVRPFDPDAGKRPF